MTNNPKGEALAPERKGMYWNGSNLGLSSGHTKPNIEYVRGDLYDTLKSERDTLDMHARAADIINSKLREQLATAKQRGIEEDETTVKKVARAIYDDAFTHDNVDKDEISMGYCISYARAAIRALNEGQADG